MIYNSELCSSDDVAVAAVIMWAYSWESNAARCVCVFFFFKGEEKGLNPLSPAICLLPKVPDQRGKKKKKRLIHLLQKHRHRHKRAH